MPITQKLWINLSPFGQPKGEPSKTHVPSQQAWPADTFLQGGMNGVVISMKGTQPSYLTAFVEAVPKSGGFFRGEGVGIAEAESASFAKYIRSLECEEHEWESRGYTNGGGFCKRCNFFAEVFTGADLGQFCKTCSTPTVYGTVPDEAGQSWFCPEHHRAAKIDRHFYLSSMRGNVNWSDEMKRELRQSYFMLELVEPDWLYDD